MNDNNNIQYKNIEKTPIDNIYKAAFFERPDYIPVNFVINDACWHHYPKEWLWDLMEAHHYLFPGFARPKLPDWKPNYAPVCRKDEPYKDPFGCVWTTADDGITGIVKDHPLSDWSAYGTTWHIPDPELSDGLYPVNWTEKENEWAETKKKNGWFFESLRHGHTFMQLCDLRGYQDLIYDMYDEEPLLDQLIDELTEFNLKIVRRFVRNGCTMIGYPEDLGMQKGSLISPDMLRRYIKPAYRKLMQPARDAGIAIEMHSDGDIRQLADDLVESGVQILNIQDLVNGIDWIAGRYRGKVCVDLDVDRQKITPYGTPKEIDDLIRKEVEAIAMPEGGMMFTYGLYPGIPQQNVEALMDAFEKYMFYYS